MTINEAIKKIETPGYGMTWRELITSKEINDLDYFPIVYAPYNEPNKLMMFAACDDGSVSFCNMNNSSLGWAPIHGDLTTDSWVVLSLNKWEKSLKEFEEKRKKSTKSFRGRLLAFLYRKWCYREDVETSLIW